MRGEESNHSNSNLQTDILISINTQQPACWEQDLICLNIRQWLQTHKLMDRYFDGLSLSAGRRKGHIQIRDISEERRLVIQWAVVVMIPHNQLSSIGVSTPSPDIWSQQHTAITSFTSAHRAEIKPPSTHLHSRKYSDLQWELNWSFPRSEI